MVMGEADTLRALRQFNTHWETGEVSPLILRSPHHRRSFAHVRERLPNLPFELIVGPRQVGKTTLMGHLMASLITDGVPPARIMYVPADFPSLELEMNGSMRPVIEAFERFVLREEIGRTNDRVYLFLDEVQSLEDWGRELKALYDAYHTQLRLVATGSSSAALLNPASADFPGRVNRSHIHPLKFGEVVNNAHPETAAIHDAARAVRTELARATGETASKDALAARLQNLYSVAFPLEAMIRRTLDSYIVRGGYPATQQTATDEEAFRFLENTVDTVLSKDLKLYEKVRKPNTFRSFLAKLAKHHAGKFVSANYAKDLGVDKETPASWKVIAEEMFLVHQLPQLNESFNVVPGRADKAYLQDSGMRAYLAASVKLEDLEATGYVGHVVEGILFDHLRRLQFNTLGHRNGTIGYWAKPEVDFIAELPRTHLVIECKYRQNPSSGSARVRAEVAGRNDCIPLVATRTKFDVSGDVWLLPVWLLLLLA